MNLKKSKSDRSGPPPTVRIAKNAGPITGITQHVQAKTPRGAGRDPLDEARNGVVCSWIGTDRVIRPFASGPL